jgi:hypothetical protein
MVRPRLGYIVLLLVASAGSPAGLALVFSFLAREPAGKTRHSDASDAVMQPATPAFSNLHKSRELVPVKLGICPNL